MTAETKVADSKPPSLSASEIGWQFVQEYYTILNKEAQRLHCFYTRNSYSVHGTECENVKLCHGQIVRNFSYA
jgi:hypothetical protein